MPLDSFAATRTNELASAEPCAIVIFGATGDLTQRKLLPAIYNLKREGLLHENTVVIGFAGTCAEVAWQLEQLHWSEPATLDYNQALPRRVSVLPSRLIKTLEKLGADTFVARAGNGVVDYRGGTAPPPAELPANLFKRLKAAYDPANQFPAL